MSIRRGPKPNGGRSHKRDERTPQVASEAKKLAQRNWRIDCLDARQKANKLTDKNQKEIADLIVLASEEMSK